MKIYLKRRDDNLIPLSQDDFDKLKRIKNDQIIEVDYKKPRNPLFHNKFMSMVRVVFNNQDRYEHIDQLLNVIKVDLGYYDSVFLKDGSEIAIPRSISFAKMDEIEFEQLYESAITLILSRYLPTVPRHELERYINEIARYAE